MRNMRLIIILGMALICISATVDAQFIERIQRPPAQTSGGMPLMEALQNRKSQRSFSSRELSDQQLSDLLWAAYGINRPDGFRTVPSARSYNEFDIYMIKEEGWYVYDPEEHSLLKMGKRLSI